jgi:hypothetical protein
METGLIDETSAVFKQRMKILKSCFLNEPTFGNSKLTPAGRENPFPVSTSTGAAFSCCIFVGQKLFEDGVERRMATLPSPMTLAPVTQKS